MQEVHAETSDPLMNREIPAGTLLQFFSFIVSTPSMCAVIARFESYNRALASKSAESTCLV